MALHIKGNLLHKEERVIALVGMLVFTALNSLLIANHYESFTRGAHVGFWSVFYNHLNMSGYDVFSLIAISCLRVHYNVLRHPLFIVILLPLYWINHWLMPATEFNFAPFLMAAVTIVCDVAGLVLFYRIIRETIGCCRTDATWLSALFYGFAHVMVAAMVPDHFAISLPLLMLTLWITGERLKKGMPFKPFETALLFLLTAGITLTNGVKVALAAWIAGGKRVFSFRSIAAFVVPTLMLGGIWLATERFVIEPQERSIKHIEAVVAKKDPKRIEKLKAHDAFVKKQNGMAINKDIPLIEWSDMTTPRWKSAVDNLFGESLQLHRDYLMEDVQQSRPVFVPYRSVVNYVVEGLLVALLAAGCWVARREKFFLVVLSWFAFDMLMHMGFGFGLNEVYIMTAHWAFIIPIAAAYLLRRSKSVVPRMIVAALAVWLWAYNATIIIEYLA